MGKPVNRRSDRSESPFADRGAVNGGVRSLIESGESAVLEFKSTARLNLHTEMQDPLILWSVVKTIAAFMNTNGGTLLVGVNDRGRPVGIEKDYPFVKGGDRDGWELSLTTAVKNALGPVAATDLAVGYSTLEERTIARIDVRPGAEPVFASRKGEERQIFFARLNNSTEELSGPALLSYQRKHWPELAPLIGGRLDGCLGCRAVAAVPAPVSVSSGSPVSVGGGQALPSTYSDQSCMRARRRSKRSLRR